MDRIIDFVWLLIRLNAEHHAKLIVDFKIHKKIKIRVLSFSYFASSTSANTPAASGAAADVPECFRVHCPYKSVVATPIENKRKLKREDMPLLLPNFTEESFLFIPIM